MLKATRAAARKAYGFLNEDQLGGQINVARDTIPAAGLLWEGVG
jgi:hypothetical protein